MAGQNVKEAAARVAKPVVESLGLEFVSTDFEKESNGWALYIYIDKEGGVNLDDCEKVHLALDPLLDACPDVADRHDFLSVSSPGLDRPIVTDEDYRRSIGKEIEIKLYKPLDKKKQFVGALAAFTEETITLAVGNTALQVERKDIALARLSIKIE